MRPYSEILYPKKPTITRAIAGNETIDMCWNYVQGPGTDTIGFTIYVTDTSSNVSTTVSIHDVGQRNYRIGPPLQNGDTYSIYMTSSNMEGTSQNSNTVFSTPYTIPDPPTSLATTPYDGSLNLTWKLSTNTGGSPILGYIIGWSEYPFFDISHATTTLHVSDTSTNQTIIPLTNDVTYYIAMVAYNRAGNSVLSQEVSNVPGGPPVAPTITTPIVVGDASADVFWTENPAPLHYPVQYYTITLSYEHVDISNIYPPVTRIHYSDLSNGDTYTVWATATNQMGTSPISAKQSFSPYRIPDAPTGLTLVDGSGIIHTRWKAPLFNGGRPLLDYGVYVSLGATPTQTITGVSPGMTNTVMYDISGLQNDLSYSVYVKARTVAGYSPPSTTVDGKPYTIPNVPSAPTATAGQQSITVSWTEPYANGSPITGYIIYVYTV